MGMPRFAKVLSPARTNFNRLCRSCGVLFLFVLLVSRTNGSSTGTAIPVDNQNFLPSGPSFILCSPIPVRTVERLSIAI